MSVCVVCLCVISVVLWRFVPWSGRGQRDEHETGRNVKANHYVNMTNMRFSRSFFLSFPLPSSYYSFAGLGCVHTCKHASFFFFFSFSDQFFLVLRGRHVEIVNHLRISSPFDCSYVWYKRDGAQRSHFVAVSPGLEARSSHPVFPLAAPRVDAPFVPHLWNHALVEPAPSLSGVVAHSTRSRVPSSPPFFSLSCDGVPLCVSLSCTPG